jgi:hypothetical protein
LGFGSKETLKSVFVPGGILLLTAVALLAGGFLSISAAAVDFYYYAVFGAGLLLAWRFHSSRVLFALITLLLAHRAIQFFSGGRIASLGPGRIAFETSAFLLPITFIVLSVVRERGLTISAIAPRLFFLFFA